MVDVGNRLFMQYNVYGITIILILIMASYCYVHTSYVTTNLKKSADIPKPAY